MSGAHPVEAVLLDIEGTTTPVSFVHEVLFPYARAGAGAFLESEGRTPEVQADLDLLRAERQDDVAAGREPPPWGEGPAGALAYVHWLIDQDRKSTGLKSLQGKIWRHGYEQGALRGQVYPDVPPAMERWRAQGRRVCIYSSGSVLAQQLLFRHADQGDLTPRIDAYFDTTSGPKKEPGSYRAIATALDCEPARILFLSDVTAELDAAREAGCQALLSVRPAHPQPENPQDYPVIHDFAGVLPAAS